MHKSSQKLILKAFWRPEGVSDKGRIRLTATVTENKKIRSLYI